MRLFIFAIAGIAVLPVSAQIPNMPSSERPVFQASPNEGQQRKFTPPDWLKRRFHLDPSAPQSVPGVVTNPPLPGFALNRPFVPNSNTCAIPLTPVHPAPGLVFRTPVQTPRFGPPLRNEVARGIPSCRQ